MASNCFPPSPQADRRTNHTAVYLPLTEWLAKPRKTAAARKLRVTILYECLDTGERAKRFSEELAAEPAVNQELDLSFWDFRALGVREVRNTAAGTAATADLVILSLSGKRSLSAPVQGWIEMWAWLIDRHPPALVALFAAPDAEGARIRAYLRQTTAGKGLRFFAPTIGAHPDAKRPAPGDANPDGVGTDRRHLPRADAILVTGNS